MQPDPTQGAGASTTRQISQWDRALLAQWFANTERSGVSPIAAAYVSKRNRDDPRLRDKIVIAESKKTAISYVIHRPMDDGAWILARGDSGAELGRFRLLPEALNAIRPHRATPSTSLNPRPEDRLARVAGRR